MTTSNMSTEGLFDATLGTLSAMAEENDFAKRVEHKKWALEYVRELKHRAFKFEHDLTMLRLSGGRK